MSVLSNPALSEKRTLKGIEIDYWTSPALFVDVLCDGTVLVSKPLKTTTVIPRPGDTNCTTHEQSQKRAQLVDHLGAIGEQGEGAKEEEHPGVWRHSALVDSSSQTDGALGLYSSYRGGRGGHPLTVPQYTKDHLKSIIFLPPDWPGNDTTQMILHILAERDHLPAGKPGYDEL